MGLQQVSVNTLDHFLDPSSPSTDLQQDRLLEFTSSMSDAGAVPSPGSSAGIQQDGSQATAPSTIPSPGSSAGVLPDGQQEPTPSVEADPIPSQGSSAHMIPFKWPF